MIFTRFADFPRSAQYLRLQLPTVVNVPRIANAMREIGGLDRTAFANALKPGHPPILIPIPLPMPSGPTSSPFWFVAPDKSNRILLKLALFEDFEKRGGPDFVTSAHVSTARSTPGAREFSGSFDKHGMIDQLSGSAPRPGSGKQSLGFHREQDLFLLGAAVLGALATWGQWSTHGRQDPNAGHRFAVHAYRAVPF